MAPIEKARVLLVDDKQENLLVLKVTLESLENCEFITCSSGAKALDYLKDHEVAVIALDIHMPVMDGFETARRIRLNQTSVDTPILFVTALNADETNLDRAYELGAVDFISKPVHPKALQTKISFFADLFLKKKLLTQIGKDIAASAETEKGLLLETALDAVVGTDENNRVVYWNQHAATIFGWTGAEILNQDMTNLIIPERHREGHRMGVKRFLSTGVAKIQNRRIEIAAIRKNGEEFPVELTVTSVRSATGLKFYSFIRDITDRRKAEKQLSDQNTWLAQILDRVEAAIVLVDPTSSKVVFTNSMAKKIGLEDPIHQNSCAFVSYSGEVLPPEKWPRARVSRGETIYGEKYVWKNPQRSYEYLTYGSLVPAGFGRDAVALICHLDVTELSLAQRELERTSTLLEKSNSELEQRVHERTRELSEAYRFAESVLENIPNMIFVKEAKDLRFVRFNRAGENLLGIPRDQLLGKNDFDLFPKDQAEKFQAKDRDVLKGSKIVDVDEEIISTQNGDRVLHTKKIPIRDESGQPRFLVGISEDITDRKKSEDDRIQLAEARAEQKETERVIERFKFLSDATSRLLSSLDLESILTELTQVVVPTLGDWCSVQLIQPNGKLKQLAVAHKNPEKVKWAWRLHEKYPPPDDAPGGPPNVLKTGKSELMTTIDPQLINQSAIDDEHRQIMSDLGLHSYLCVPIRVRNQIVGALSVVTSAESSRRLYETDLRLAEDLCARAGIAVENARLFRESRNLNRVKDEFLATLSHELRTPINVIQGNADILLNEHHNMSQQEIQSILETIQRNTKVQTQIVSDLLDVSSIITGKLSYSPQMVNPGDIACTVVDTIKATASAKNISVKCVSKNAPKELAADPTRLSQILWNLINNAVKFTPSGGHVELTVEQQSQDCVFRIIDSGIGIDPDFLPFVFDRFRQADSSMARNYGGLGLGLSIVKSLTEVHGGKVSVSSNGNGRGTTFEVRLPILTNYSVKSASAAQQAHQDQLSASNEIALKGLKILIVEDSADNRALVKRLLVRAGAEIFEASSPEEARKLLSTQTPDLILSDIGMPGENGFQFIRRFRNESKKFVPAIALTAYVRPEEVDEALSAGFQGHISKPVTKKSLVDQISKIMHQH